MTAWEEAAEAMNKALEAAWDNGPHYKHTHKLSLTAGNLIKIARDGQAEDNTKMKAILKGIMKIRDEITNSDGDTPRWVSMDLNSLCNEFMDEKGNLK